MYKKILIPIFITFLLVLSVNALTPIDGSCLNDNECVSPHICQGGICRAADIGDLLDLIPSGDETPSYSCTGFTPPYSQICSGDSSGLTQDTSKQVVDTCTTRKCEYTCITGYTKSGNTCVQTTTSGDVTSDHNSGYNQFGCFEQWECTEWSACISGQKTRTCTDINDCGTEEFKLGESFLCTISATPTCFDGILNQNEAGVDCGGPCAKICATCYDQEENCHGGLCEEGVDCGGPCMPCTLEKASRSVSFWIIFITAILVLLVLVLGFWYWKLKGSAEDVGEQVTTFTKKPPTQPSSMLRI